MSACRANCCCQHGRGGPLSSQGSFGWKEGRVVALIDCATAQRTDIAGCVCDVVGGGALGYCIYSELGVFQRQLFSVSLPIRSRAAGLLQSSPAMEMSAADSLHYRLGCVERKKKRDVGAVCDQHQDAAADEFFTPSASSPL